MVVQTVLCLAPFGQRVKLSEMPRYKRAFVQPRNAGNPVLLEEVSRGKRVLGVEHAGGIGYVVRRVLRVELAQVKLLCT